MVYLDSCTITGNVQKKNVFLYIIFLTQFQAASLVDQNNFVYIVYICIYLYYSQYQYLGTYLYIE